MKKESKVKGLSTEGNTEAEKYEDDGTSHIRLKRSSFSGKKKKELLKAKRIVKEQRRDSVKHSEEDERTRFYESFHGIGSSAVEESQENRSRADTEIPSIDGGLKSIFEKESDADVEARKRASRLLYDTILPGALGICVDDTMITSLEMPVRPVWNAEDSSAIVDARESSYFKSYLDTLQSSQAGKLNSFELNLEVWRQLWRVVERSDLLLIVVDIRFPRLNFPTALFELIRLKPKNQSDADMLKDDSVDQTGYPKEEEARGKMSTPLGEKPIVIILNKVDLVTMEVADSWVDWFKREYAEATVIAMSSIPVENVTPYREDNTVGGRPDKSQSQFCKGMLTRRPFGELELLAAVR